MFVGIVSGYDDDIESADDLYDAIGTMLEGLDSNMEDDTIREICCLLHNTRLKYAWLSICNYLCRESFVHLLSHSYHICQIVIGGLL